MTASEIRTVAYMFERRYGHKSVKLQEALACGADAVETLERVRAWAAREIHRLAPGTNDGYGRAVEAEMVLAILDGEPKL